MLLKREWGMVTPDMIEGMGPLHFEITGIKIVPHRTRAGLMMILGFEVGREAVMDLRKRLGLPDEKELNPHISVLDRMV